MRENETNFQRSMRNEMQTNARAREQQGRRQHPRFHRLGRAIRFSAFSAIGILAGAAGSGELRTVERKPALSFPAQGAASSGAPGHRDFTVVTGNGSESGKSNPAETRAVTQVDRSVEDAIVSSKGANRDAGSPPAPSYSGGGLISLWRFDETSGSIASDSAGSNPLTLIGSASFVADAGRPGGRVLELNPGLQQSDWAESAGGYDVDTGDFTMLAWVKPFTLRQQGIFVKGNYSCGQGALFDMPDSVGTLRLETANASTCQGTVQTGAGALAINVWQHVAVSVARGASGNLTKIYINGVQVAAGNIPGGDLTRVATWVGRVATWGNAFSGRIDEVALVNHALTGAEVLDIKNNGFCTPQANVLGNALSIADGDVTPSVADGTDFGSVPVGGSLPHSFTVTNAGGVVGYWKLDEGSGGIAADSSVNALNGTLVATSAWQVPSTSPMSGAGNALVFNSGFVQVADNAIFDSLQNQMTIEAWIYETDAGNNTVIDRANYNFLFEVRPNGQTGLGFYNPATSWIYSSGSIPVNQWAHVAVTWDGATGTLAFYLNGALLSSFPGLPALAFNAGPLNIGRQEPNNCQCNIFTGVLDEVRLWKVARTQAQILASLNAPLGAADVSDCPLPVDSLALSGSGASRFSVGALAPPSPIPAGGSASFAVTYNPDAIQTHDATVTVNNGDPAHPAWNFAIRGVGLTSCATDTTPPVAVCQPVSIALDAAGSAAITAAMFDNGSTDNCGVTSVLIQCPNGSVNHLNGIFSGGAATVVEVVGLNGATNYRGSYLGTACAEPWAPFGTFCDEAPDTNNPPVRRGSTRVPVPVTERSWWTWEARIRSIRCRSFKCFPTERRRRSRRSPIPVPVRPLPTLTPAGSLFLRRRPSGPERHLPPPRSGTLSRSRSRS